MFTLLENRATLKHRKTANIVFQVLWLALESEDKERALDPGIQKKNQPGSPRMEEEPGLPSRDRHYVHLREHVNFTRPFGIKELRTPNMSSAYTGPEPGGHTKSMHGRLNYGARRAPAIEIQP